MPVVLSGAFARVLRGLAAGLLVATAPLQSPAQVPAPAAAPAPISTADILQRAGDDQRLIERVVRRTLSDNPATRFAQALDEIGQPVDEKLRAFTPEQLRSLPVVRLESFERHWGFDARRFDRWQAEARSAFAPDAQDAAALDRSRAAWTATRSATAAGGAPPVLAGRVDAMVQDIDRADAALSDRIGAQVDLQRRGNAVLSKIQSGQAEVAAAIASIDRRLLRLDAPPIWSSAAPSGDAAFDAIQQGIDLELRFARAYAAAAPGNLQALRVLQVVMLPVILWLAWASRRATVSAVASGEATAGERRVLRRPLSAWLLLCAMAVLLLESDAPLLVLEFALVVALVPALRLLPTQGLKVLGAWPYAAIGLYLVDSLGLFVMSSGFWYRWYQLGVTVVALAVTLMLLRSGNAQASPRLRTLLRVGGRTAVVLLGVAGVANVAGNTSLAETLASGAIDSAYFAVLLSSSVQVCLALLQAALHKPAFAQMRRLHEHTPVLMAFAAKVLGVGAVIGWGAYTLDGFRLWRPGTAVAGAVLGYRIEVGELTITPGHVLVFVLSVFIAFWAARLVRRLLRDELQGSTRLPRGVGNSIASLSYYAVLLLGFLAALSAAGFQVGQLAIVFGALGVGIGFGLQNIVNNFVSGLVLMFERPIQPGDVVEVAGTSGRVRDIGMRATVIRTFDGADVVVPNGTLLTGNLTNWTLHDRYRRIEIEVSVAYGSDPTRVLALLETIGRDVVGVVPTPPPAALMTGYGKSALNFVLRVWTHDFDRWVAIRSELLTKVLAALEAEGLQIPYDQLDVHLRTVSEQMADAWRSTPPPTPPQVPAP